MRHGIKRGVHHLTTLWRRGINALSERRRRSVTGRSNDICIKGTMQNVTYDIVGDDNSVCVLENAHISNTTIFIRGNNNRLKIGTAVLWSGGCFRFEGNNCVIEVGENTTASSAYLQAVESNRRIVVGKDCMLAVEIDMWTSDFHTILDINSLDRINPPKDIVIEDHVWIGAYVLLLKGVRLGSNSIIAARSVVTKSIPANTEAAGIPAKPVREGVTWNRDKDLS